MKPNDGLSTYLTIIETINTTNNTLHKENNSTLWYRGQRDSSWQLTPQIQRILELNSSIINNESIREYERGYATRFQIKVSQLMHDCPSFDDYSSWITLMRHYGAPTRLLDWSLSPLIALYFAVTNDEANDPVSNNDNLKETDACVWVINPRALNRAENLETTLKNNNSNAYIYSIKHNTIYAMLYEGFKKMGA